MAVGTGAIGACLVGLAVVAAPGGTGSGEEAQGRAPVTIAAPPPLPSPLPEAMLPRVEAERPTVAAALEAPSVVGGAPPGKAGIWSAPAEFAPPE